MDATADAMLETLGGETQVHLRNVADNLQLLADLGYGDVTLAVPDGEGTLWVLADARPVTAAPAVPRSRVGERLDPSADAEAYRAMETGEVVSGLVPTTTRGIRFSTTAYPMGERRTAVLLRTLSEQVVDGPGKMERVFMAVGEGLLDHLRGGPLVEVATGEPFSTTRKAGDGLLVLRGDDVVEYASPNAIDIMRSVGIEGPLAGLGVHALPGSSTAITPVLRGGGCVRVETEANGQVLVYRTLSLPRGGAVVLMADVTEARRREQQIKVKEATIREVHHRVKNNLQTIASLLRIQARRSDDERLERALGEAVERIAAMAVVHEMLAATTDENVDFTEAARTVVDLVRQSVAGPETSIEVAVEGSSGDVPASLATSLALVVAELVHNAIEHGQAGRDEGSVVVAIRRLPGELHVVVRDDGIGLPEGFEIADSANLGLAIVQTVVQDDLGGSLAFGEGRGTAVTLRVPIRREGE